MSSFTIANLLLFTGAISLILILRYFFCPFLRAQRLKEGKVCFLETPTFKIFLDYHHRSPNDWFQWIQKQTPSKQKEAYALLLNYLSNCPSTFKPIIKDVFNVLASFQFQEAIAPIENLLPELVNHSNRLPQFYEYYESAIKAIVKLDSILASDLLKKEFEKNSDNTKLLEKIIFASITIDEENIPYEIIVSYLLNSEIEFESKTLFLKQLTTNAQLLYKVINNLFKNLHPEQNIEQNLIQYCFLLVINLEENCVDQKNIFDFIDESFNKPWLANILTKGLIEDIESSYTIKNHIVLAKIISIVNPTNYNSLKEVLSKKHQINEEEKNLIENSDSLQYYIRKNRPSLDAGINTLEVDTIKIPIFLEKEYLKLEEFLNKESSGIKLIYGKAEQEKFLILKKYANLNKKKIIIVNIDSLAKDSSLIERMELYFDQLPNKIIYIPQIEKLLENLSDNNFRKIYSHIKFYVQKTNCLIIASLDIENSQSKNDFLETQEEISNNKTIFPQKHIVKALAHDEKLKILEKYKQKIQVSRMADDKKLNSFLQITSSDSELKFTDTFLDFLKLSLLTHGSLMEAKEYQLILESKDNFSLKKGSISKVPN